MCLGDLGGLQQLMCCLLRAPHGHTQSPGILPYSTMMFFCMFCNRNILKIHIICVWGAWGSLQHPIGGLLNVPESECTKVLVNVTSFNILVISWRFCNTMFKSSQSFCLWGFWGPSLVRGGLLRVPRGPTQSSRSLPYEFCMTSLSRFVTFLLKITYSLYLGGLRGACKGPPGVGLEIRDHYTIIPLP